jgi:hypothetical protein
VSNPKDVVGWTFPWIKNYFEQGVSEIERGYVIAGKNVSWGMPTSAWIHPE